MSTVVGSVSVRQLEDACITANDVRNCCHTQYGSALSFRHDTLTKEVQFYTESPEWVFKRSNTIPALRLQGSLGTYTVLLMPPGQLHTYIPEPKVVPTRSKKLLLT